ncbi:DUF3310 domain-containing protein [Stutzerimonas frequens]|uniref:DUF3310 domain-containing protein n=1 Tax=Stutzerimonas frequens TaxID=2968969 RepID=UPI0019098667|nr:DUF3310 domain-containing protein [Stutzerimonas frequens]UXY92564.1 hypothetical protein LUZ100_gp28 [Pseudomonas phage LUZ100]MBK3757019.1 DUF3310 domain-containing protein [Stutzerimonas frequens]MBK3871629.1 DUF3310 domain-containing protein [Stutzerimonas frequens]MBK3909964.1 DUF3310 domain-containing protein [Stutzerimonas frequens]MBK3928467.1 DUF3310 domain-containing protein [Stutzerimonas frequens]
MESVIDMVNHPGHYKGKLDPMLAAVRGALVEDVDGINIECFEAMVSMMTIEELRGYLRGNSFKYRWRYQKKAGIQDLEKAEWYEKKLLRLERAVRDYLFAQEDAAA